MAGEKSAEETDVIVARALRVQSFENQTGIDSPESKGIRQSRCNGGRTGRIGNIVQITGRIRMIQIDRRWENTVKQRQKTEDGFNPTRRTRVSARSWIWSN